MRLCYKFMVHDREEFFDIYDLIKRRKFGILEYSEEYKDWYWIEFPNKLFNIENFSFEYRYIRVYFNNDYNLRKFKKKIKRLLKPITCGNDKCSLECCEYHPYNHKTGNKVEYLWRCILADEEDYMIHWNE